MRHVNEGEGDDGESKVKFGLLSNSSDKGKCMYNACIQIGKAKSNHTPDSAEQKKMIVCMPFDLSCREAEFVAVNMHARMTFVDESFS